MFQLYSHQTWACLHRLTELHCLVCTFATTGNVWISLHLLPDNYQPESFFHLQMQVPVYKNLITIFMKKAPEVVADINFSHGLWLTILLEVHWTRSVQAIVNWPLADESELKKHSVFQEISQVVGLVVTEKWKSHSMKGFNNEGSRSGSSACLGTSESRWASKFVWTTLKPCHGWFDDSSPHWHQEDAYQIFSIPEESPHEGAEERWQLLKKRVVQHNIKALSDVIPTMGLPNVK